MSKADFAKACAEMAAGGKLSYPGADPEWLFLGQELKHLAEGAFWESRSEASDFFLDLHSKLKGVGVELIFVPVPAKAAIYPGKLVEGANADSVHATEPFLAKLADAGITVIDLEPELRAAAGGDAGIASYCRTDAHPSPATCERVASLVADKLSDRDWAKAAAAASSVKFAKGEPAEVKIKGDLIPAEKRAAWKAETVKATKAGVAGSLAQVPAEDAASPVVVVGDSHAQIFSLGGEMLMTGCGVVDHLQANLGFTVFLATTRGSSSQAQRQIYKGPEFWDGKKALVWVSSAREFTQERRWLKLPRLPK